MKAIDFHVHPPTREYLVDAGGAMMADTLRYFNQKLAPVTVEEFADEYRALDILGVVFAWDARTATGLPAVSNEFVADIVRRFPKQFVGFASVDPHRGAEAAREIERAVRDLAMRGLKMHPIAQAFDPSDRAFYPLWEKCALLGVPVLFHTGHTGLGAGAPGGHGLRLKYARPLLLDDVAADFPELTIIAAHPSWPWAEEGLSVALHKTNVWIDLSGWSPKYFPEAVVRYANGPLQDRVLFGSDYPFIKPPKWLADFEAAPFKPEVRPKILLENAKRLLRLA